jgi:hypothetical protein
MTNPTLLEHLHRTRRDRAEPLRVLVVHDSLGARKQVERLLMRIRGRLGADLRMACDYQRIDQFRHREERTPARRIELVFLAAGCSATLPHEALAGVTSLLPTLKASHGALALLSGTNVPRRLDVVLVEQFLRTHAQRAGVAFFSGCMPGLGCPGCSTPKRDKAGRSGAKSYCVLHAPRNVGASPEPSVSQDAKPIRSETQPTRPAKAGIRAHAGVKRSLRGVRPELTAR